MRALAEVVQDPIQTDEQGRAIRYVYAELDQGAGVQTWTEREWVHSPFYVDELVCEVTPGDRPRFVVQDANYNVTGVADEYGDVLGQWAYDPYGSPLKTDIFEPSFPTRLGHQGLPAERLTGLADEPSLIPGADLLYHNRNRTYSPKLGRFLQKDPNGTAQPLLGVGQQLGTRSAVGFGRFDTRALYADGLSLYAAVRSDPVNRTDPSGLVGLLGALLTGGDMAMGAADAMDMAATGVSLQMQVAELWTGYALGQANLADDVLDWETSDDEIGFNINRGGIVSAGYAGLGTAFASEFLNRRHGGAWHNAKIDELAKEWKQSGKYSTIYKNRALRDAKGRIIFAGIRPDIQGIRADGSGVDVLEVQVTNRSTEERLMAMRKWRKSKGVSGFTKILGFPLPGRR